MKVQAESFHLNGHITGTSSTNSKVRVTSQNSIKLSGSERVNQLFLLKSPSCNVNTQESTFFHIKMSSTKGNIDSSSFVASSEIYLA